MTVEKKKRGRPRGTEMNDRPTMRKMAELIIDEPGLKPTSALKRVLKKKDPPKSIIRRVQIKWKASGAQLLVEARARRVRVTRGASNASAEIAYLTAIRNAGRAHARMEEMLGIGRSFRSAVEQLSDSPVLRAQRDLEKALRSTSMLPESPTDRLLREMRNNPTERLMRDMRRLGGWPY